MKIKEPNEFFRDVKSKITKNDILSVVIVFLLGIINNFQFFITESAVVPISYGCRFCFDFHSIFYLI